MLGLHHTCPDTMSAPRIPGGQVLRATPVTGPTDALLLASPSADTAPEVHPGSSPVGCVHPVGPRAAASSPRSAARGDRSSCCAAGYLAWPNICPRHGC